MMPMARAYIVVAFLAGGLAMLPMARPDRPLVDFLGDSRSLADVCGSIDRKKLSAIVSDLW
jgi:hypothetical protein